MERCIIFSKKSELQLSDIFDYIFSKSNDVDIVKRFVNELMDKTEILKKQAFVGRQLVLLDNIITQYRYLIYKDYLIFYRLDDEKVYIDRILNSKQDYIKEFIDEL